MKKNKNELAQPHDATFKKLFGEIDIARNVIEKNLPEEVLNQLDMNSLEKLDGSFINEELKETFTDILYGAKINGSDAYLSLLLEHKSYPDKLGIFQVAGYVTDAWRKMDFTKKEDVKIVEAYVKKRLVHGVRFAEKRGFNTTMYSWEMELNLDSVDFNFEELVGLNFRKATKEDGLNYKKIIHDAFGDEVGKDALEGVLKDSSIIIYILEKENQAIGSATLQLRKDLSLGYIYDIAILKEHRRQGWGSYLLQSCVEALKVEDIDKASLLVTGENKNALELYRKIGFKETDIDLIMTRKV